MTEVNRSCRLGVDSVRDFHGITLGEIRKRMKDFPDKARIEVEFDPWQKGANYFLSIVTRPMLSDLKDIEEDN